MSRVSPVQTSFNGGEISRRLSARIDQGIYAVALEEMTGFAPLLEGPAEAMPGTIVVEPAAGPCRLFRFEYNTTQGHVVEASAGKFRVFTNDALIVDASGNPVEVASSYSWADVQALRTHQSYDVMYCLLRTRAPMQFRRDGATAFSFAPLALKDGPFDDRNDDKSLRVSASALTGAVTLSATSPIFAATDVGSLFQMEAEDFGDIPAWEPGITVTQGQLLTFGERVYRVVGLGAGGRTGGLQPVHTEGVEWDGVGRGQDINEKDAGGVQLEYVHDRIGILRITGFTDASTVSATVLRHLPFSATTGNYEYHGGYWGGAGWTEFVPSGAAYAYGTWRWRFGAFSDTRGWPEAACVWNERLWLAKDQVVYGSAAADLLNFSTFNELGELTNDMALTVRLPDPNPVLHMVGEDRLLILTAKGMHALGPGGAATGIGPNNRRIDPVPSRGAAAVAPVELDGRAIYIGRSGRRVHEASSAPQSADPAQDLNRYARHIAPEGTRLVALASQQLPLNHLWALRSDGTLWCAVYVPEEQALGWARRTLAAGMAARSICTITDPNGVNDQLWIAAEFDGAWFVLRMAPWREDGDSAAGAIMLDMALSRDGAPVDSLVHPHLKSRRIEVVADGAWYTLATDPTGRFTLPEAASNVIAGLPFAARMVGMPIEAGGDNGPARGKMARIGTAWVELEKARGLRFGEAASPLEDIEGLSTDSTMDEGFALESGFVAFDAIGDFTRRPRLCVERVAPFPATVLAWCATLEVSQR
ncbi:hypothetical protein [Novosphingobium huizhouense]|uniref:hypothetical protein n=1 Tax=Novosphingobium huizhouense TaxID=2866625 RepID=UPI001CD85D0B|nr:hypothetical protein [Novosphingobium huizhouense]